MTLIVIDKVGPCRLHYKEAPGKLLMKNNIFHIELKINLKLEF